MSLYNLKNMSRSDAATFLSNDVPVLTYTIITFFINLSSKKNYDEVFCFVASEIKNLLIIQPVPWRW